MRPLTVVEVIDHAVTGTFALLQQGGFTLERKIQPGLPALYGDLSLLSQCLQNLIANSVKYSGQSRWVEISAQVSEGSIAGQEAVHISVRDRGLGISEEDLPHVFEPFYRSRRTAVHKIPVAAWGSPLPGDAPKLAGELLVLSEEAVGCVFTLHLPLNREGATKPATQYVGTKDVRPGPTNSRLAVFSEAIRKDAADEKAATGSRSN